jgi:hypothetical protein
MMNGSASGSANATMLLLLLLVVTRIATSWCFMATTAVITFPSVSHLQSARGSSSAAGEVEILALFNHHFGRRHLAVRKLKKKRNKIIKKIRMKMSNFIIYIWQSIFVRFFFNSIKFNSKNFKSNEKSKRV